MNEHCPLAVWQSATDLRKAENEALTALLDSRGVYKVGANGVAFKVGNTTLTYGASDPKLYPMRGREVYITQDPDDVSYCAAWTADRDNRRFIARLQCNERVSPLATVDDLRTANATVNRRRKVYRQADREAPARMRNAAAELRVQQRAKLAELRATGTDGLPHVVNTELVRTGFEGLSRPVQTTFDPLPEAYANYVMSDAPFAESEDPADSESDPYANVDYGAADLLMDRDEETGDGAGCAGRDDLLPDRTDAEGNEDSLVAFG